jgi:hypothetical protein
MQPDSDEEQRAAKVGKQRVTSPTKRRVPLPSFDSNKSTDASGSGVYVV